jgi:hypothetical protein
VNPAYKHLESKLRIADMTLGQIAGAFFGLVAGGVWAMYISPFGVYVTLFTAVYIAGIPVGAAFIASVSDFDLWLYVRSALGYRRGELRFQPGPGESAVGYRVFADGGHADDPSTTPDLDLESLWHA